MSGLQLRCDVRGDWSESSQWPLDAGAISVALGAISTAVLKRGVAGRSIPL